MYVLRFKMTNLFKVSLVAMAAMLAACLLALVVKVEPSQAAFPGSNGKIAFESNPVGDGGRFEIYTVNPDGTNQTNISNNSQGGTTILYGLPTAPR